MARPVEGVTKNAIEFLRKFCPEGPWVLTAIIPDGKTETQTFEPAKWANAVSWIEDRQGIKNMYFHVNPVRRSMTSKASKEDMARMSWLHIDIDPRAGEEINEERERAYKLLMEYKIPPTIILDSGGGLQGFWKLSPDPMLEIDGNVTKAQELEAYNQQLEKEFGADHCHNVDRIMRLPGTVNVPTAKKARKGRVPVCAQLLEFFEDRVYDIKQFTPAVRVQTSTEGLSGGQPKVKITGNVPDIGTEELKDWAAEHGRQISEHTLALIATGEDPIDPTKYPSRSEALFRVCCDLVRANLPDEMIYAVITGSNEIAASVKDKPSWESYALRQIERAKEEAINPWLRKLNEKHAVIADMGGKCRIISEVFDPGMNRTKISKQSFEDFRNRYRHIKVLLGHNENGQAVEKAAGNFWIDHPQRRQYETIVFAPGREIDEAFNLWRGFSTDALPGDKHDSFLKHIYHNICCCNKEYYEYLVGWMARAIQQPDSPGEVAVVLRGKMGTGKSFFAKVFGSLFGRHFLQVSDPKHLVGSFNAHLRDTVVLFGDEAFYAGDKKHEAVLKMLITEELFIVEGKGVDAEAAPNFTHVIMASNSHWVVPAGAEERRFFVLDVGNEMMQNHAYFKGIKADLDEGGYEHLLHYLMSYDLSEYEVRRVPKTQALQDQKLMSMEPEEQWLYEKLYEGRIFRTQDYWPEKVVKDLFYDDYINDLKDQGRNFRLSKTAFGKFLSRALPEGYPVSKQEMAEVPVQADDGFNVVVKKRTYVYYIPTLKQVREYWDENFGGPFSWPKEEITAQEKQEPGPDGERSAF